MYVISLNILITISIIHILLLLTNGAAISKLNDTTASTSHWRRTRGRSPRSYSYRHRGVYKKYQRKKPLPLCHTCSSDQDCLSGMCRSKLCMYRPQDVSTCGLINQRRKAHEALKNKKQQQIIQSKNNEEKKTKKKACERCNGYWECENNRCYNGVCAEHIWRYKSCVYKNSIFKIKDKRNKNYERVDEHTISLINSDDLLSNKKESRISILRKKCATCKSASDCLKLTKDKGNENIHINYICIRGKCVSRIDDLLYCVMDNRLNPPDIRNNDKGDSITVKSIGGRTWTHLKYKRDLCAACGEWHECKSRRCVSYRCVEEKDDLHRCHRSKARERRRRKRKRRKRETKRRGGSRRRPPNRKR